MIITEKTSEFDKWLRKLKDIRAKSKILFRIQKLETNEYLGDCKPVGDGISEMRINYAKGFRIYFKEKDNKIVLLLIVEINQLNKRTSRKRKKSGTKIKNNGYGNLKI